MAHLTKAKILLEVEYSGPETAIENILSFSAKVKNNHFTILESKTEDLGVFPDSGRAALVTLKRFIKEAMSKIGYKHKPRKQVYGSTASQRYFAMQGSTTFSPPEASVHLYAVSGTSQVSNVSISIISACILIRHPINSETLSISLADPESFKTLRNLIIQNLGLEKSLWTELKNAP